MILSEQEKNRIRGLHKKHSVIKEQQGTPMGIMWGSCDPYTTGSPIDYPITLDGQHLTQNDVGTEIEFPSNPGMNGKIDSIFPASNPNATPVNAVSTPCPPPPVMQAGIVWQSCDPYTTPSPIDYPITLDGQPLLSAPNQGVGAEIEFPTNPGMNGKIDSIFIASNQNATPINAVSTPCPPPPTTQLGIVFANCDPHTSGFNLDIPITLDGVELANIPNQGVGTEISFEAPNNNINGIIDSVFVASNPNSGPVNAISTPCPPPVIPPIGARIQLCNSPNTAPIDIDADVTVGGQRLGNLPNGGVGLEVYNNQANPPIHGTITTNLYTTSTQVADFTEGPCPQTQTMWRCQTQGQPCIQDPNGNYNDEVTCNAACSPSHEDPCRIFNEWDKYEQKEFCKKCIGSDTEPMCECCYEVGLI